MKLNINNKEIIMIILSFCFLGLGYAIYNIKVNEYMTSKNKIKQRKKLRSETKNVENKKFPEIHVSLDDINAQLGSSELNNESVKIVDKYGNVSYAIVSKTFGNPTFYKPGTYRYGSATYIPSYEDSVFLSKTLNGYSFFNSSNKKNKKNKKNRNNQNN
jgi:hypothetical protein